MSGMYAGVTGDAVVLELRLARLASRSIALTIDAAVQLVVAGAGVLGFSLLFGGVDDALGTALSLVLVIAVIVGYPVVCEVVSRGRSVGKLAMGLRVVRDDGGPTRFRHALIRALVGVLELWLLTGAPALIASLLSRKGKRLGDQLAGTVVVRERVPAQGSPIAMMPPPLVGWAATLDLSRLPDDLALGARQFLARAPDLLPAARTGMANRLAGAVAAVVSPPPPPGVPAEPYLAAVLAERRMRELRRMAGAAYSAAPPGEAYGGPGYGGPGYGRPPYVPAGTPPAYAQPWPPSDASRQPPAADPSAAPLPAPHDAPRTAEGSSPFTPPG